MRFGTSAAVAYLEFSIWSSKKARVFLVGVVLMFLNKSSLQESLQMHYSSVFVFLCEVCDYFFCVNFL